MKKFFIFLIALAFSINGFSQDYRKNRKEADKIKANAGFYWGESGECRNLNKAGEAALNSLLDNISGDKSLLSLYLPTRTMATKNSAAASL